MSPSLRTRRLSTALALALATGAAGTCALGVAAPAALAQAAPAPQPLAGVTDQDARKGAVAAMLLDAAGRPTFVEVIAPTVEQAVRRADDVPGSDGVVIDTPVTALATNDPYRSYQWSLDALKADSLPAAGAPAAHVVAVVDTGVRASHEDFAPGQVRCDLGADFTSEGLGACADPKGHGTHVAGIVGAVAGNGKGVASLAPGTTILPVRVLDSTGSGGSIAVAKGIVHAADKGAKVINLSLGGPGGSSALDAAVQYATDRGALVVVSAGNNRTSGNEVNYPAASPGALSVASTDQSGTSSSFSYSGPTVDLAAPGGSIASLWGDSDRSYKLASGTSMAAPAVSAVASLYRAAHPAAGPAEVAAALIGTATDLEAAGRDDNTGAGLVNPYALLVGSAPAPTEPAPTQPAPTEPAPTEPTPTQPAPTEPTPTQPAPTQPAPTQPAPTQPAPTQPAPVVKPPAAKAPAPRARVLAHRVARRQAVPLVLTDFRPASTVTVLETWVVVQRVQVKVNGRTVVRTRTSARTVVLGTFRVAANGSVSAKVLPVQSVRAGRLVIRGFDRAGKVVQRTAAIRVG
jgi:subtilisin family serine protease